jgi:hypothetical protein
LDQRIRTTASPLSASGGEIGQGALEFLHLVGPRTALLLERRIGADEGVPALALSVESEHRLPAITAPEGDSNIRAGPKRHR